MTKTKRRVIQVQVNHDCRETMEKILTDRDNVLDNFDILHYLNPKNTVRFCEKLLSKPTAEEIEQSNKLAAEMQQKIKEKDENEDLGI